MRAYKTIRTYWIVLIFFALPFLGKAHPVHVSLVNINLSEDGKVSFVVKLFMDDFEAILNEKYPCNIKINADTPFNQLKIYAKKYVEEHIKFKVERQKFEHSFLLDKFKTNHEAIWLFFEVDNKIPLHQTLDIKNSLMCDKFQDQTNLLIMNYKNRDMSFKYDNQNKQHTFAIE